MSLKLSIEENEGLFLDKMITFEKRVILQHYFSNKVNINNKERDILKKCPSAEIETIALIGILLGEKNPLNILRLRIGSVFQSDVKLAQACNNLIDSADIESAEAIMFHYDYEYDKDIEIPIIDYYIKHFK
ncbi:MAG: hypothetical protein CMC13_09390 [Flavobacteriaceae bacterium]|nr:hypothetical protein [Flavobacteriaceae bacterium]|tara:strand:+ start:52 stop:444 length:393 start_codon:yes stop_codon:yes gene_type:complete